MFAELPYEPAAGPETGGGQIMMSMVGRTHSSADAVATSTLFVTCDQFIDEDAPEDVAAAVRAWWTEVVIPSAAG